jgi:hypothetical protein
MEVNGQHHVPAALPLGSKVIRFPSPNLGHLINIEEGSEKKTIESV